jgi:hypothetical protein
MKDLIFNLKLKLTVLKLKYYEKRLGLWAIDFNTY